MRTLGVLGGMGPAASADFLRVLTQVWPAQCDQDHPRVVMLSEPSIPDRRAAILDAGQDPTPYMHHGMLELCQWGADLLAVPCNTAFYFIDTFRHDLPVPLMHLVVETIREAEYRAPEGGWLLATTGTRASGIYQNRDSRRHYPLHLPGDDTQANIQQVIELVKTNQIDRASVEFQNIVEKLWAYARLPLIIACTELPLAYRTIGYPEHLMVSSTDALAAGCLREMIPEVRTRG